METEQNRILYIEDEPAVAKGVIYGLEAEGFKN